jgi:hypothetical protein
VIEVVALFSAFSAGIYVDGSRDGVGHYIVSVGRSDVANLTSILMLIVYLIGSF